MPLKNLANALGGANGGGIYLELANGTTGTSTAALTSLTVNQNQSIGAGAGLYVNALANGVVSVDNNIFDGNKVTAKGYDGPIDVTLTNDAALNDIGYNLVGTTDTMFNAKNHDILNDNPVLADALAQNGAPAGYQQTLALAVTSPGYETGDQSLAKQANPLNIDERGFTRQAGKVSIGAEDPDGGGGGGGGIKKVVNEALNSSLNPSLVGQTVTFTASLTGSSGTPTGDVTFEDGSNVLGDVTLDANGVATLSTSGLTVGSHNITANYGGDATYNSSSASLTQVVNLATSSTSLTSSLNPSPAGQSVIFTATVSGSSGTPTGTVTFLDGSTELGAVLLTSGNATLSTAALSVGSHSITANYGGDTTYATSSASLTQKVNQKTSNTSLTSSLNPSTVGQTVTFTAHVSSPQGGTPTGSVTFSFNSAESGMFVGMATVDANGNASFSTSGLAAGSYNVAATYSGDANYTGSSAALTQVVNPVMQQANDSVSLTSSLNPATVGQTVTFNATVNSMYGTPTGTITFWDGSTTLGTVTLDANGNASISTSSLTIGSHNIQANYSGDTYFNPNGASLTQVINGKSTSTGLTSSLNPAQPGQSVTFSAAVTASGGTPTGTLTFTDDGTTLGTVTLDANGNASFTTSSLYLGNHTITANYNGDATYASSSTSLTQVIGQASTTTSLTSSANPSVPGQAVSFTAAVTTIAGTPTGTVTFQDGSSTLGTGTLAVVNGTSQATFTTSSLTLGSHNITANYGGDTSHTSSSAALTQNVSKGTSNTNLTSSANPSMPSQPVTFTATVTISAGTGAPAPTGSVTFMDGGTVLGSGTLSLVNRQYQATFTASSLALGSHFISALYAGDNAYFGSGSSMTQTVAPAFTITMVNSNANPAQPEQSLTFTAQIMAAVEIGAPTLTGSVTFYSGTSAIGSGEISLVNGMYQASMTTALGTGGYTITAIYSGDADYVGSSGSLDQIVGSSSLSATTMILRSSASPSAPGQAVTFTATVNGDLSTLTGSVTFLDGTTVLGTGTLSGSNGQAQATLTTSALVVGAHDIIAIYSGDGVNAGISSSLTQTVSLPATTTTLTSSANPSPSGQPVTFTATVAAAAGMGTPTGSVAFYDGSTLLGTGTLSLVNGQEQATFTTAALGLGAHTILAIYSSDSNFADSGSSLQQSEE